MPRVTMKDLQERVTRAERNETILTLALRDRMLGEVQETIERTAERSGLKIAIHLSRLTEAHGGIAVMTQRPAERADVHSHVTIEAFYLDDMRKIRDRMVACMSRDDETLEIARAIDDAFVSASLVHVTLSTGHARVCQRSEIGAEAIRVLAPLLHSGIDSEEPVPGYPAYQIASRS